jgi:hypothetical protein
MSTQEFTDALKRPGWLTFAAVVLFAVGCLRAISAIYYFADSARINDVSNGAFSDNLWLWGSGTPGSPSSRFGPATRSSPATPSAA